MPPSKVWLVERLKPFELADMQFAWLSASTPAAVLDPKPRGALEAADVGPMAVAVPTRGGKVRLGLVDRSGKRRQATRTVRTISDVPYGAIAYVPTGRQLDGAEVWGAVLHVAPPSRKIDRPWEVERYYHEVSRSTPRYSEAKKWATAWSIFCAYKRPDHSSCKQETYFD